jgi:cis-3-alkyl-4-acyloxetan-2-one decarboxylase
MAQALPPAAGGSSLFEVDGVSVHVEGAGDEVLLMIHGWPDTHRLWDAQVAAFGGDFRCVRFSLPGFDTTPAPPEPFSLQRTVALIAGIVDAVSPSRPVTLMVHDWGCLFGYVYLVEHPHRVGRLIGLDIGDAGSRAHRQSLSRRQQAMVAGYQLWLALAWRVGGRTGDAMTRRMARWARAPGAPGSIGARMNYPYWLLWTGQYREASRRLRHFMPACPTLFVQGRRKPFSFHSRQWAEALAQRPGNRVVELATGHWVMRDASFNTIVADWLAATPVAGPPD